MKEKLGFFLSNLIGAFVAALILALRAVIGLFGIDIFTLRESLGIKPLSDDEIFDVARRICPVCQLNAKGEADEIGYYSINDKLALKCPQCGTVFLGTVRGEILPITEIANIRPWH